MNEESQNSACVANNSALKVTIIKHTREPKVARLVTLVSNLKKSPWLLSRCKESPSHIQALIDLLQPNDKITVAIKLESSGADWNRYLVVASTGDNQKIQESVILGVDIILDNATIGLVLPICDDMDIQMDGDGGFIISTTKNRHSFHPVSVQSMWSALQSLLKAVCYARYHHQKVERTSHGWVTYYFNLLTSASEDCVSEWNKVADGEVSLPGQGTESIEDIKLKINIKRKLRDIMTNSNDINLDTISGFDLRVKLEDEIGMKLEKYKRFINEEMVTVMGQMDSPSQILEYLYLGSEWNASNFEELRRNRVGYILNVTNEIENFFPGCFKYCNVRVEDTEETHLIRHWNNTYKFISDARKANSRILVHCRMGVSRSASTVIAYIMKEYGKPFLEAYQHVKQKRSCVNPNQGFMHQLGTYEGILDASKHRHIFRCRSAESLNDMKSTDGDQQLSKKLKLNGENSQETIQGNESNELKQKKSDIVETDARDVLEDSTDGTSKKRPSTFSIDSLDAFSPGMIPVVAELEKNMGAVICKAGTDDPESMEDIIEDDVLTDSDPSESVDQLPLSVLDSLSLPSSSMLRKFSLHADDSGKEDVAFERQFQPTRKLIEMGSIDQKPVQRSFSWPRNANDEPRAAFKASQDIRRKHILQRKGFRTSRSNTVMFDG